MQLAKGTFVIFTVALLLTLASPTLATVRIVNIGDFFFSPDTVAVSVGDTVRWTHIGAFLHTTTSNTLIWDSGTMNNGDTFEFQFNIAGSFPYHCSFHPTSMNGIINVAGGTWVRDDSRTPGEIPESFGLEQNYPNPFNPSTTIDYALPRSAYVRLEVYNVLGERVSVLRDGVQDEGYHSVVFEGKGLPSGIYFYRLRAGDFVQTRKFMLLR